MEPQKIIKILLATALIFTAQVMAIPKAAAADSVAVCDTCQTINDWQGKALGLGPGYHYLINNNTLTVRLFHVHPQTGEGGTLVATRQTVPPGITYLYLTVTEYRTQGLAGITFVSSPNDVGYPKGPFFSNPYGGFTGSNAYEVASSNTVRTRLGQNIANAITGATGNAQLDALGLTFTSFLLSAPQLFGEFGINIVITWPDGSTNTFVFTSDNVSEAQLAPGASRDADGNRIPDSSVNTPNGGPSYSGTYFFNDSDSLSDWLNAMQAQGIPVTGPSSRRLECTWDGQTLKCKYVSISQPGD